MIYASRGRGTGGGVPTWEIKNRYNIKTFIYHRSKIRYKATELLVI